MRFYGYPYNDLVICKDSPDYLAPHYDYEFQFIILLLKFKLCLQSVLYYICYTAYRMLGYAFTPTKSIQVNSWNLSPLVKWKKKLVKSQQLS